MSGLCGWMGKQPGNDELLNDMAAPLWRFDRNPPHLARGDRSAVALCAPQPCAHLASVDGLLIALWGRPGWNDSQLAGLAEAEGHAHALATAWRNDTPDLCTRLSGSFALAILDSRRGEALLATDRMGVHPLLWTLQGEALCFATSADCLRGHAEVDPQSVYDYVYFHMVPGPATIYRGVQRLLPGHYLHYRQGRISTHAYWRMHYVENREQAFPALRQAFLAQLRESMGALAWDDSAGAFLSGGTDSSTIAGMLTACGKRPARTYSIGFDAEGYDEMEYARIAARHFGTIHHEYYVSPDDVVTAIPSIAAAFDQPFGNASAVPAYYCALLAQEDGVRRMIGGDGGDELFGGNERYARQQLFDLYSKLPRGLRAAVLEPLLFALPGAQRVRLLQKARSYVQQASVAMPARLESYNLLQRYGAEEMFEADFLQTVSAASPLAMLRDSYGHSNAESLVNRMLALDLKITLADNDLPKVSKACELAGIEAAFPFLDDAMVAFSAQLSPRQKLRGTQLRWFFKEALRGFLPDEILTKPKHGFGLPFGVWLQTHRPLQEMARDSLSGLSRRGIVRAAFTDKLMSRHVAEHAGYHGTMVWVLMMLEQWYRQREGR